MIRIPGVIPIFIHPWFWVVVFLIGFLSSGSLIGTILWGLVIVVSVIVHEMGHAIMARLFKKPARIDLVAFGGATSYPVEGLNHKKQFVIVLGGPLFGFFLFLGCLFLSRLSFFQGAPLVFHALQIFVFVNLFWTIVNLLPVLPLDGGQMLRIVLEGIWGVKGLRASLFIGMVVSLIIALIAFIYQSFILGALFFLFAFQSFDSFRKSKFLSSQDQNDTLRQKLIHAEAALQKGSKEEAKSLLEQIIKECSEGILFQTATQYLAFIYYDEGKKEEAYKLLVTIKENLAKESLCLLHLLAEENKNYPLVIELSASCFEMHPSFEVALRNAKAFAQLNEPVPSGGWLQTAWSLKHYNVEEVVQDEAFSKVVGNPTFQKYLEVLKKSP